MADSQELKVFISWSGGLSQTVAEALRKWLPDISDRIVPFMSDIDIAAGQRGLATIEKELVGTTFGIIVVTQSNQNAPWLNFEAGALSKVVGQDVESRVAPLLVDISNPSQITGPISQFQAKAFSQSGMLELVLSITALAGADPATVTRRFDKFWDELKITVENAAMVDDLIGEPVKRGTDEMVEELLNLVRAMRTEQSSILEYAPSFPAIRSSPTVDARNLKKFASQVSDLLTEKGVDVRLVRPAGSDERDDLLVGVADMLDDVDIAMLTDEVTKRLGINIKIFRVK